MSISIIVAMSEDRVIGVKNELPWYIPENLKNFKKLTTGHAIIMGRKTYESIGHALPNRTNIVISRTIAEAPVIKSMLKAEDIHVVKDVLDAITKAKSLNNLNEIFCIGGGQVYEQCLPLADKCYITKIYYKIIAKDEAVYFPEMSKNEWQAIETSATMWSASGIAFKHYVYQRSNKV